MLVQNDNEKTIRVAVEGIFAAFIIAGKCTQGGPINAEMLNQAWDGADSMADVFMERLKIAGEEDSKHGG